MSTDTVTPSDDGPEVMAAIDTDGEDAVLVIADVTTEGTWLTVPEAAAASLSEWR